MQFEVVAKLAHGAVLRSIVHDNDFKLRVIQTE